MIRHHLSETTLAGYATATLPHALSVVTATHLAVCSHCRQTLATLEATGGVLLEDLPPIPLLVGALDHLLTNLDAAPPAPPPILNPDLPAPLNRTTLGRWWPIGFGVRYRPLQTMGAAWGGLIHAWPERSIPKHGHAGLELTCVVSGRFADGTGEFAAGDLCEPSVDHDRPPVVVGSEPCLCIMASEGMRLRGLLGLAQRMIG